MSERESNLRTTKDDEKSKREKRTRSNAAKGLHAVDGGDVDDGGAVLVLLELRNCVLHHLEHGLGVGRERLVETRKSRVVNGAGAKNAGAVNERGEPAQLLDRGRHGGLARTVGSEVGDNEAAAALLLQSLKSGLVAANRAHSGTLLNHLKDAAAADARGPTGDDNLLTIEELGHVELTVSHSEARL